MTLKVMQPQFPQLLAWMTLATEGLILRLYSNDWTPSQEDLVSDYEECAFLGYEPKPMTGWQIPVLDDEGRGSTQSTILEWTFNGGAGEDIFGYYVTDALYENMYWAERLDGAPVAMSILGQRFELQARLTLRNDPEV